MKRQGDLLLMKTGEIPKGAKRVVTGIVLAGEATGHHHRLVGGDVFTINGAMFLDVKKSARLVHEEHKPITLSAGKYAVVRQREYAGKDMTKVVVD
jgi:hypothetical protein